MATLEDPFIWLALVNALLGAVGFCFSQHLTRSRRRAHLSAAAFGGWGLGIGAVALSFSGVAEWLVSAARVLAHMAFSGVANAG